MLTVVPARRRAYRALILARLALTLAVLFACGSAVFAADRGPIVAAAADAFVAHASGSDTWSIGSAQVELVVGFDTTRTLTLQRLFNPANGRIWDVAPAAAGGFTAGTERIALTSSGATTLVSATTRTTQFGVELTFLFEHRGQRLQIARVFACYSGSPTIETWARITSTGGDGTAVSEFAALQLIMQSGHLQWLGGLRGDTAGGSVDDAFVVADRDVDGDEHVELGATGRSSETFVPLLWVQNDGDEFYAGLMWSGAWHADVSRAGERLQVRFDFPGVTTMVTPARGLDLPHAFFGLTRPAETDASGALHQFIRNGIRRGRPFTPLVTYNTWFVYGTTVNEDAMVAEMDRAAALGAELFVLDAGWYVGAGETSDFDFDSGLGSWTADPDRFPSGLASLTDYAHGLGMKFGLWVEPERVALSTVERP
ncbi:MAG TPA: alpha-galactosidase, partial [Vicinamibacterales bacterium]|nr:alpha-galactosidase [Vicinamibacterales bacterium]